MQIENVALRPEEAADLLSVSRSVFYDLMRRGEIPSFKIGRCRRITPQAIREFVQRQEGEGEARAGTDA